MEPLGDGGTMDWIRIKSGRLPSGSNHSRVRTCQASLSNFPFHRLLCLPLLPPLLPPRSRHHRPPLTRFHSPGCSAVPYICLSKDEADRRIRIRNVLNQCVLGKHKKSDAFWRLRVCMGSPGVGRFGFHPTAAAFWQN